MRKIFSLFTAILFAGSMMAAVVSGTAYDVKTAASVPEGWTANGDYSTSGGGFFKITESTSYLQTDEFCQNGISSIVIKARRFGTVTGGKEVLTIEWIETGSDIPVELGTVSPTSTSLNNCQLSNPASIAGNKSGVIKIYSKNASSGGGAGVQTVTITYTSGTCAAIEPHTVSFYTGAGNPAVEAITETEGGAGITLPAGPAPACTNWAFAGWATAAVAAETTTAPTLLAAGATYKPAEDVTLYAVYKRTEESGEIGFVRYEKVTEDPEDWSGIYLLAANTSGDIYYTFTGQNGNNTYGASENYTPGTTEKTDWEVTVAKTTNGYSIYHTSGAKYLGLTGSGNNLNFNASFSANNYEWILSAANGAQSYAYNTRFIECNTSSSYRVACYTSSQKRFYLYKRIEDAIATYYYISAPTCEPVDPVVEPTVKTLYCKVAQDWWKDGNAAVGIYAFKGEAKNAEFPGVRMEAVEGEADLWKAEIDTALYNTVIFTRFNPNDCNTEDCLNWGAQTEDLEIPADKDLYTITSATAQWIGLGNKVTGEWSVYGEEPVVVEPKLANGYYLVGDKYNWTPAAERLFVANGEGGEYVLAGVTLAAEDSLKVVYVENDAITTWFPGGTDNNYVVDAAHAGEKDIYFRPDGQGGDDWYEHCIFIAANEAPVVVELQAVSEATTWDFSKITANTGNTLYNNTGIQLTDESTPSKNDEMVYANYSADFMTFAEGFDAATMAFKGEYPIRKNQYCQNGTLRFKTTVAGTITVKFSDTGSSAKTDAVKRYLVVNGEQTEYWTSRGNNGTTDPHDQQLNVETQAIAVPAGDVTITGSSAIVVSNVTFTPSEEPVVEPKLANGYYLVGDKYDWTPAAERLFVANGEGGEYVLAGVTLAAEDSLKVVYVENDAITTWFPGGTDNNYVVDAAHAGVKDIYFRPDGQGGDDWYEHCIFIAANEEPVVEPKLANGYYLVGDKYDWTPAAERLFVANGEGGEYVLAGVTLAAEDSLKVVYVENDAITTWFPGGTDNNYVVDAAHAGVKDIYFRPDYQGSDDWYEHCIFIAPNSGTAIDKVAGEAKAVKILKNGMLIIEKNGVKYNVLGVRL